MQDQTVKEIHALKTGLITLHLLLWVDCVSPPKSLC
jgi:hypothetical protein